MQRSSWNQSAPGQAKLYRPLSPEQRSLIGWPLPGHPFWTHGTVGAVAARYQLADSAIAPYLEALPPSTATAAEELPAASTATWLVAAAGDRAHEDLAGDKGCASEVLPRHPCIFWGA